MQPTPLLGKVAKAGGKGITWEAGQEERVLLTTSYVEAS